MSSNDSPDQMFTVILIFGLVFFMSGNVSPDQIFIFILIFGVAYYSKNRHASVRNAASPAMSRTKFYLWVAVTAVLFASATRAYSSYFKWRTLSTVSLTVEPPKQLPDVLARP